MDVKVDVLLDDCLVGTLAETADHRVSFAYDEEFLFATNDILLKRIFVQKNAPNGLNGLLYYVFPKKDYNYLLDCIEDIMQSRVKPDFGENHHLYFQKLIEAEIRQLTMEY